MPHRQHSQIQRSYKKLTQTILAVQAAQPTKANASDYKEQCSTNEQAHPNRLLQPPQPTIHILDPERRNLRQTLLKPLPPNNRKPKPTLNPYGTSSPQKVDGHSQLPIQSTQTTIVLKNDSDQQWIGAKMRNPLPSHARIWIQNVNGLDISYNFNPYLEHLEFIKRYKVNFLSLTETHLNHQNQYVKENIEAFHHIVHPEGHVLLTNTPISNYEDTRQSGGILASTQGKLSPRYAGGGSDKGGRFTWMDFYGKEIYLQIYTVYRVCNNSDSMAGDNQAWTLQREWLQGKGINVIPRLQVLRDLRNLIEKDLSKKRQIIVVGDFNENVLGSKGDGVKFMNQLGLQNSIQQNVTVPSNSCSHSRGSTIINGIWSTPYIQQKISACGLAPFDFMYPSDHRGLFLDLDIFHALDTRNVEIQPLPYRRLKCTIPKRVKEYSNEVVKKWENHKISEKIKKLEDMSTVIKGDPYLYNSFENFLNQCDKEIGGTLSSAEKHCCKVSRHCSLLFTPSLQKLLRKKRQLQQLISKKKKLNVSLTSPNSLQDLKTLQNDLHSTNIELREYTKTQREKRDEYLEERAKDLATKRDLPRSKVSSIVTNLKHIEHQINDASKIRNTLKPGSRTRTDYVMIPALSQYIQEQKLSPTFDFLHIDTIWPRLQLANGKDIVEWYNVEDQEKVQTLILEALQKHFSQASETLITSPKWRKILCSKDSQDALLDGTFEWDEDAPMDFRELLSTFGSHATPLKQIALNLSYEAFKNFINASKEKTSTSPSSRHYGHYKALLEEAPDVLKDIFCLMDLSIRNGIFLQRYKKTLTTLICKESGNPYLHRFRPIHIIEAELQFISKYLWAKKMLNSAENNNLITDAQYGGRHGRQAQSSVLNTVLYYDLHRQLRKDFTSNDDDIKANFDREIPHYSAAETRSIGMSHEVGQFLVKATSSQDYFIRTPNGPSASSYTFNEDRPIWGLGQGVGWAGACWQLTASTISKCMNKSCLGIRLSCPEGKFTVQKLMDFFIDDTKKVCNQAGEGMTLLDQTQFNMQKHANYIDTTGGALALDKCTWYQIKFSFNDNGDPHILKKHEMPGEIEVNTYFDGPKVKIKRLEYDQPHRTLGYFVSPDGQTDMHYNFTLDLVRKWKTRVTSSRLNSSQILQSYEAVLKRQILYQSVATSFSYEQCDAMMKLINPILLHSANVQEHFPR